MYKTLIYISVITLILLVFSPISQAEVFIEDTDGNFGFDDQVPFTQATNGSGSGNVGDYNLMGCAVPPQQAIVTFNEPTPGSWTELDMGSCANSSCQHAIWGMFTNTSSSASILCSWSNPVFAFVGVSFRYSRVDTDDPIIGVSCVSGPGAQIPTAPSIETEAGSQVVRIFTYELTEGIARNLLDFHDQFSGTSDAYSFAQDFNVNMSGVSNFQPTAGPTGEAEFQSIIPLEEDITSWRACTIAIRMSSTNVPTLSEWGLIAMAGILGLVGFMVIRRRQATA